MSGKRESCTPQEAADALRWVVEETRVAVQRQIKMDLSYEGRLLKKTVESAWLPDLGVYSVAGYCGTAQSFADLLIGDCGIGVSRPFALHTLPRPFAHVALTAEVETTEGPKMYLLDPTFRQFCPEDPGFEDRTELTAPGLVLANLPEGEFMCGALVEEGFFELTPRRAAAYLSSFSGGIEPYPSEKQVMAFFTDPQPHEMNRFHARKEFIITGQLPPPEGQTMEQFRRDYFRAKFGPRP